IRSSCSFNHSITNRLVSQLMNSGTVQLQSQFQFQYTPRSLASSGSPWSSSMVRWTSTFLYSFFYG
ncbi:hypothetical protein D0Y65_018649, partial [Glycine soja]